jgi:PAS domain S-box-containing protein
MNKLNKMTAIQSAQLRQLFGASNVSLVTSTLLALILAYMQREVIAASVVLGWISLVLLAAFLRAVLVKAYQCSPVDDEAAHIWLLRFRLGVLAIGILWGSTAFLMFPANDAQHQMFLVFMLAGLSAGGVIAFSADLATAIVFSIISLSPLIIRLFITGGGLSVAMGMAGLLYLGFMIFTMRHINSSLTENIVLRLEAAEREEIVRASEERYRLLLNHTPVGIIHYDTNLVINYCNERFADILHNSAGSFTGMNMNNIRDQSILTASKNALKGDIVHYEGQYYPSSGDAGIWIDITCAPSRDATGGIIGGIIIIRDISERKQAERLLIQIKAMVDISQDGFWITDLDGKILQANESYEKISGYSIEELVNMHISQLDVFEKPEEIQAHIQKITAQGYDLFETRHRHKDGHIIDIEISVAFLPEFQQFCVFCRDITVRKAMEAKLNAIFNAAVEGIITVDKSGAIVSANTAVEAIFGYKPEELTGCGIDQIMPSLSIEKNDNFLSSAAKAGAKIQEIEGFHKNGSVVPVDQSIAEYAIDNAHYLTYIVRDVSLRKQRERQNKEHLDQLAHVTRLGLMGEMASGIAHEVNQPLSAISSYTQVSLNLINKDNPDLVKLAEVLYKTQQQALRAGRIIHRMREFVKSHLKHSSTASINTLIEDAVSLCAAELKQNGIELTLQLDNYLPPIFVDHIHIEQVMINLIRNSIDALQNLAPKQQRQLSIHSRLTLKNAVQVRIKDNGPGIDNDRQQKIFMPFYTTKADGMGMGLSISRSLLEAHGGTLYFKSKPGKGCSFYFALPTQTKPDECQECV